MFNWLHRDFSVQWGFPLCPLRVKVLAGDLMGLLMAGKISSE